MHDEFDDPRGTGTIKSILAALNGGGRIRPRRPLLSVLPVLGLLTVLGTVLWYSYPREVAQQELKAVPIIRADAAAYKIMPNEPGGMEIAHRDSTVFETLRSARIRDDGRPIENLLAEPEEPMARDELIAALGAEPATEIAPETAGPSEAAAPAPAAVPAEQAGQEMAAKPEAETTGQPVVAAMRLPAVKPVFSPEEEKKAADSAAATEPAAGSALTGSHYIQLGSLRSRAAAEKSWASFQTTFPQLEELKLRVQEADLGAQGTYYRVQAGPVEESEARAICRSVEEKQPGGCLVVSR